ncbi:MAG: sulfatase/phosphatase domain-containing protein, partial [Bacteroidota bacterium]
TDFAPTLLDLAGIGSPDEVQGESFASILRGETSSDWRDSYYYHYYEYPLWHHVKPHYGIRNNRYKLIHFYYKMDVWEFYDLKKDPQELKNLIDKKKYAAIIEEMKQDIKNHQETLDMDTSKEAMYKLTEKHFGGHQ